MPSKTLGTIKPVKSFKKNLKLFVMILLILCEVLLIFVADYTVFDNNQIHVIQQTVQITGLPAEFDGFTILQISDLHGKRFEVSQQALTGVINSLDYDAIAFTGDMQNFNTRDITPLLEILHGIKKSTPMYYISGNTGPYDTAYFTEKSRFSLDMSDGIIQPDGKILQSLGCTLLNQPQMIERGRARLWFATDFSPARSIFGVTYIQKLLLTTTDQTERAALLQKIEYQNNLQKIYGAIQPGDTLVGIIHIPLPYKTLENPQDLPPYDLVLAGHYHGGQIRLPLLGAIYIPDETLPLKGLFPSQALVSGLFIGNGIQQYVSRGLGAGARISFLQFRLFDTPEINLITLRANG
jgi:uncharacterized protein